MIQSTLMPYIMNYRNVSERGIFKKIVVYLNAQNIK